MTKVCYIAVPSSRKGLARSTKNSTNEAKLALGFRRWIRPRPPLGGTTSAPTSPADSTRYSSPASPLSPQSIAKTLVPQLQEIRAPNHTSGSKPYAVDSFSRGTRSVVGSYPVSVQELLVIEDLLTALVGIEGGRYISIKRVQRKDGHVVFQIDPSMDLALQELTQRIFPLCEDFVLVSQFVESNSHFKNGLVNHAFASALNAFLIDYQAMVAQLEHQFRIGRLSVQGLWFFCQPMMGLLHALAIVVEKASSSNFSGSATLNLLQSQAKAMAGDNAVRSLLEKMTEHASTAYLAILESMLKFINSLLHYLTFEVLEPNWHLMYNRLQTAISIDEVIQFHDFFLQKCLKECLLLSPQLLKKIEKLKSICLQYSASIQLLIPSIYVPEPDSAFDAKSSSGTVKSKPKRSSFRGEQPKLASQNIIISDSIMKFEKEFNAELQSLAPILSNSSQAEPYLTHLAQCILAAGTDQCSDFAVCLRLAFLFAFLRLKG